MKSFAMSVNSQKLLTIVAKLSILDVYLSHGYTSEFHRLGTEVFVLSKICKNELTLVALFYWVVAITTVNQTPYGKIQNMW